MTGGISQASGVLAARHALFDAITTALTGDDDVDISFGPTWPVTKGAWAQLQGMSTETDPKQISPRRGQEERITFFLEVGAWVAGHDDDTATAAFDRAFGLLDTIQTFIRTGDNITLGDTVLWCVPGPTDSDGIADQDGSGYNAIIAASFIAIHRVRVGS